MTAPRRFASLLAGVLLAPFAFAEPDISAPDALAAAQAGKLRLIDIRTQEEWRQTGVAPGAGRVDFYRGPNALGTVVLDMVNNDKAVPVALICRTGNRSAQAQKYLQSIGFTQVSNVKEGMAGGGAGPGWLRRGLPVESCGPC